jgi:hypothetical protein
VRSDLPCDRKKSLEFKNIESTSTLLFSCNECERSKLVSKKDSEKLKLLHRLHIHGSLFCSKSLYSCGVTFAHFICYNFSQRPKS